MKRKNLIIFALMGLVTASCNSGPIHSSDSSSAESSSSQTEAISEISSSSESVSSSESITSSESASSSEGISSSASVSSSSEEVTEEPHMIGLTLKTSGPTTFFLGESFSAQGLEVVAEYDDGIEKSVPIGDLVFSGISMDKTGKQTLKIAYQGFEVSYQITVIEATGISLRFGGFDKKLTQRGEASSRALSTFGLYYVNQPIDLSVLQVSLSYIDLETGKAATTALSLDDGRVLIEGFSTKQVGSHVGKITVTAGTQTASETFPYEVTNALPFINRSAQGRFIECRVDSSYQGMAGAIGNGTHESENKGHYHAFKSIGDALSFLSSASLEESVMKRIYVAKGDYAEKLDIDLPFVSLMAEGGEVKIHSSDLIGSRLQLDSSEETYVLAIRETATNFSMSGISIIHDASALTASEDPTPAVSMICQADKSRFENCYFAGVDEALTLHFGRKLFLNCSFLGRDKMIKGTCGANFFQDCTFNAMPNVSSSRYSVLSIAGASSKGQQESLELAARFTGCNFTSGDAPGSYCLSQIDSAYTSMDFLDCSVASFFGGSREELFPDGKFSSLTRSVHLGSNNALNGVTLDAPKEMDIHAYRNGYVYFAEDWDGQIHPYFSGNKNTYLNFDAFSRSDEGLQTVMSPSLSMEAGSEAKEINSVLSLNPVGGIHYDAEQALTAFEKGSTVTIQVPNGARVDFYSKMPANARYTTQGFARILGNIKEDIKYIYKDVAHFYATGKEGEMTSMTFRAEGLSYLRFIVIVPDVLTCDKIEDRDYEYQPKMTGMYVRNYKNDFRNKGTVTLEDIYKQFSYSIGYEYEEDGFHHVTDARGSYGNHYLHTSLAEISQYVQDWYGEGEWYALSAVDGSIFYDVMEQFMGKPSKMIWHSGTSNRLEFIYLSESTYDKGYPAWEKRKFWWCAPIWFQGSFDRYYRVKIPGTYGLEACNLYDGDLVNRDFIDESHIEATGDTHSAVMDSRGYLQLSGQCAFGFRTHSDLRGGKAIVKTVKGSSLTATINDQPADLTLSPYSTPDFDYFELTLPEEGDSTVKLAPGEAGASLVSYELRSKQA